MTPPTIDWPARERRARTHLEALKQEWEAARRQKRPPRYIPYHYQDDDAGAREGEHGNPA